MELPENYDESQVPDYTLPDALQMGNGIRVDDAQIWQKHRRPEILTLFERYVYGRTPTLPDPIAISSEVTSVAPAALEGKATRKEITVSFRRGQAAAKLDILLYIPTARPAPVPLFVGLNFFGNHTIHPDPDITLSTAWVRNLEEFGIRDHRATEASRGIRADRWPVERILARGYAVATAYYGDLDPDFDDGFQNGIHPLFYADGQTRPAADEWGAIGAWAWGLQRAYDVLSQEPAIDASESGRAGPLAAGKSRLVGRGARPTFCHGHLQRLRLWRRGALAPPFWRDGGAHQYALSPLVLRQLPRL